MTTTNTENHNTVDWHTDEDGYSYPRVTIGQDLHWVAYHSVSETTEWVDGHLVSGDDFNVGGLDIVALNAADEHFESDDFDLGEMRQKAKDAWDAGSVLLGEAGGVRVLYTPLSTLTGENLATILARFRP